MNKITRNDEEQAAFKALLDAVGESVPFHYPGSTKTRITAEALEHELLKVGYVITKIEPINI